jgi:hypothetical protein
MAEFRVGDRIEAGWLSGASTSASGSGQAYQGPLGTIIGADGSHYRVRWDNGVEASFPRVELRLSGARQRRFKAGAAATEPLPVPEAQEAA